MNPEDELLRSLPARDVDAETAERIRRRAHALLHRREQSLAEPQGTEWAARYHRIVEPTLLIGLALGFVLWAVHDTVVLFH